MIQNLHPVIQESTSVIQVMKIETYKKEERNISKTFLS
jgi:hypothetical protein